MTWFKWYYTHTFEIDAPIQKVWKICADPSNWPKWIDQLESCHFDGELKEGSTVKAKVKSRFPEAIYISILVIDIKPYESAIVQIKAPLMIQENRCVLHSMSPQKTRINMQICIKSVFVPFMKSYFFRKMEKSKEFKRFLEVIEQDLEVS